MIDLQVLNTIEMASVSSASRGAISVIDRLQFGLRRKKVALTNIHNNMAALLLMTLAVGISGDLERAIAQLLDLRVLVFAFLLQASANAFSYGFRHMKVASIIIVAKLADIFIAPMIYLLFAKWSLGDFLFAIVSSLGCVSVLLVGGRQHVHRRSAFSIGVLLVAQGALSPWFMENVVSDRSLWLPFTAAVVIYRLFFALLFSHRGLLEIHRGFKGHDSEYWFLHGVRAGLTLSAQAFQVLALSWGRPVVAWPILNATGLFAILISSLVLKEHATRHETIAILFIAILGTLRVWV